MADTSAFPTIRNVLHSGQNYVGFKAGGTIKRGMFVGFEAAGADWTVIAGLQNIGHIVGVAMDDATSGQWLNVALDGCIVTVCEGAGAAIDAGSYVQVDDCAVGGTVACYDPAVIAHAATLDTPGSTGCSVGLALEDISANGTGRILLRLAPAAATIS